MLEITSNNLTITTADLITLPLHSFDLLILIEPDPEGWMPHPKYEEVIDEFSLVYNDLITDELEGRAGNEVSERPLLVVETRVIWTGIDKGDLYEGVAAHFATLRFSYFNVEGELFAELACYLRGLYVAHPEFRVALVGATMENEVMEVGNLAAKIGFTTTILTRYCFSQDAFIALDELFAHLSEENHLPHGLGSPDIDLSKFLAEE